MQIRHLGPEVQRLLDTEEDAWVAALGASFTDIDLFHPEPQSFPSSPAEVTAAGFAGTPEALWACQETSGTTLADASGNGHTLTVNGAATKILLGQRAVGLFDGASFRSQRSAEAFGVAATADHAVVASTSLGNLNGTTKKSLLMAFRMPTAPAGDRCVMSKMGGAGFPGWYVGCASNGAVYLAVRDGTTEVRVTAAGNHADGGLHWGLIRIDAAANTIWFDTDLGSASASTAALNWALVGNALAFAVGSNPSGGADATAIQVRGLIMFSDVATTVASIQSWWRHGRAPSWLTYARASSLHTVVADDATTGDVLATWATGQIAYERNALTSTNPLKLGLSSYVAATNLIPNSDLNDGTNWPATGTKTTYDADSPRGYREAVKHTKTAINQSILCAAANGASVTLNSVYTASVFYEWDGLVTAPVLQVYRADGTTSIASVSATDGTGKRRRMTVTFTAPATEAVRIALKGSADASTSGSGRFFGPMINTGSYAMPFVPTSGGTASTVATSARVAVPGLTSDFGTIKVWATYAGQDSAAYRVLAAAVQTAGSVANERAFGVSITENLWFGAGSFDFQAGVQADLASVETVMIGRWDKTERNGWSASVARNGSAPTTDATNLAAVTPAEVLYIGSRGDGTISHDGGISKVRVYRYPELAA